MTPLLLSLLLAAIIPVHGTVLGNGPGGALVIRNDPVTAMLPAQTRSYRVTPNVRAVAGVGIDGFVHSSSAARWYGAEIASRFVPGLPQSGDVIPIDIGSHLPSTRLVDQRDRFVDLARDFAGKVTILSFVFTRCPDKDECPAISAKFSYLARHLDPHRFHLVLLTLDPRYDSPAVMSAYARRFAAQPAVWSLLTGRQSEVAQLLNRFGISSLQVSDANFLHNDKVFLTDPAGRVAQTIATAAFSPSALQAQAQHLAGVASSPLGRLELSLIAGVTALCGGSQFAGIVLLETVLFVLIAAIGFVALSWVARHLWKNA